MSDCDEAEDAAAYEYDEWLRSQRGDEESSQSRSYKFYADQGGAHIRVRLFSGPDASHRKLLGNLMFGSYGEWASLKALVLAGAAASDFDGDLEFEETESLQGPRTAWKRHRSRVPRQGTPLFEAFRLGAAITAARLEYPENGDPDDLDGKIREVNWARVRAEAGAEIKVGDKPRCDVCASTARTSEGCMSCGAGGPEAPDTVRVEVYPQEDPPGLRLTFGVSTIRALARAGTAQIQFRHSELGSVMVAVSDLPQPAIVFPRRDVSAHGALKLDGVLVVHPCSEQLQRLVEVERSAVSAAVLYDANLPSGKSPEPGERDESE